MKEKRYFTLSLKIFGFLLAFLLTLNHVHDVFSFKYGDGILAMEKFYELDKNSVDVLILGSSHAFEDINTGVLYDTYGIASYILGGSAQPYWNTYYYLVEALKTQKPRLIVLEAYASTFDFEYADHSVIIKNNLGIKNIVTLYNALKVSAPADSFDDYLFDYRWWHSRYTELSEADYSAYYETPLYEYFKGFGINFATTEFEVPFISESGDIIPLAEKTEEYYRKIIELTIKEQIPLLIVVSPYILSEKAQQQFNQSQQIAQQYGIDFINFNSISYYNQMNLDFVKDFADPDHLNYLGNVKYTKLLAESVLGKYDIPDRRNDSKYESWELHSKEIRRRVENYYLRTENDFDAYMRNLQNMPNDYTAIVYIINNKTNREQPCQQLSLIAMDTNQLEDGCLYIIKDNQLQKQLTGTNWIYKNRFNNNDLNIINETEFKDNTLVMTHSLMWNGNEYINNISGTYFLIYDNFSQVLVDICHFDNGTWEHIAN